jgi:hypothetical protein
MKTSFILTAFCILSLSIFLIWSKFEVNDHNISITESESDDTYSFSAHYSKGNTNTVESYINKSISPNSLAGSANDYFDASTLLTDGTTFHIIENPGKLEITLDKKKNSTASYYRIKKMCDGVKGLIK